MRYLLTYLIGHGQGPQELNDGYAVSVMEDRIGQERTRMDLQEKNRRLLDRRYQSGDGVV